VIAILEPHENPEWRRDLAVNGIYHRYKASVQRVPLLSAKCVDNAGPPGDFYTMENSSPFMGDLAPTVDRHDHCVCR